MPQQLCHAGEVGSLISDQGCVQGFTTGQPGGLNQFYQDCCARNCTSKVEHLDGCQQDCKSIKSLSSVVKCLCKQEAVKALEYSIARLSMPQCCSPFWSSIPNEFPSLEHLI